MEPFRSKLKRLTECSICFELVSQPKLLPCLHTFCSRCISKHHNKSLELNKAPTCPLCRMEIHITDSVQTNILIKQLTDLEIKDSDRLKVDDIANMKTQVVESQMLMRKCLQKVRRDAADIKQKLQHRLDHDYGLIMKKLNEFEMNQENALSFYCTTIDDLLSDFPQTALSSQKNGTQNNFLIQVPSFYPRASFSNMGDENVIGDLRCPSHDSYEVQAMKSPDSLLLLGVLKNNKTAQGSAIVGVAITNSYICSINILSQTIHLFDIPSLQLARCIDVPNLRNPQDMCSLSRSDKVYVADSYDNAIHMIEVGRDIFHCWPVSLEPTNISVCANKKPIVWVACRYSDELLELNGDTGQQLRKIDLHSQIVGVNHVLSLDCSEFGERVLVLCHGVLTSDCRHQVLVVDAKNGKPMPKWGFGSGPAGGVANVNHPSYLAAVLDSNNKTTSILVADQGNGRLMLLDFPSMKFRASFNEYSGMRFSSPQKVLYDDHHRLLLVLQNVTDGGVLVLRGL